jgi:CTP:molybdopterin cytidylyltransferase MocA
MEVPMNRRVGAIILAAGAGRRFGGPKAQAYQNGRSYLARAAQHLCRAGLGWISVVVGAAADEVMADSSLAAVLREPICHKAKVSWVRNDRWRAGRTGSIVRGLLDLPSRTRGALIHQVDFPFVRSETFRALVEAFAGDPRGAKMLFLPEEGGRRGHPILVGRGIWTEIARLRADEPLRTVVHRDPQRVREVSVNDPGIHRNVNTPADAPGNDRRAP